MTSKEKAMNDVTFERDSFVSILQVAEEMTRVRDSNSAGFSTIIIWWLPKSSKRICRANKTLKGNTELPICASVAPDLCVNRVYIEQFTQLRCTALSSPINLLWNGNISKYLLEDLEELWMWTFAWTTKLNAIKTAYITFSLEEPDNCIYSSFLADNYRWTTDLRDIPNFHY